MKPRHIIPTAIVSVVVVVSASVLVGGSIGRPSAIADDNSAVDMVKQKENPDDGFFSPYVDEDGNISLPEGYRQKWTHLGSWAVGKKPADAIRELHNVYTQPETIRAYNQTGEFPDGAVLVKEVRATAADRLTTGHAAWSTDIKIWFVMIKDRKERFQDNDHWGDGWGWALFEAKDPTKNVSAGYDTSCLACHTPVEDRDWVYTYGYPELKKL